MGDTLWEMIMEAGKTFDFSLVIPHYKAYRRGMLSYRADADSSTNPYEVGL